MTSNTLDDIDMNDVLEKASLELVDAVNRLLDAQNAAAVFAAAESAHRHAAVAMTMAMMALREVGDDNAS